MKVTVLMSVYNGEKYLAKSIESILNQTFIDFEFMIIDDASTDNSFNIMKEYLLLDNRINLFRNKENLGLTASLNFGLQHAKGQYIARMDADDIAREDLLEKEVEFLDNHPEYTFVSCIADYIDEDGNIEKPRLFPETNEDIYATMPKVNAMMHPGVLFRKDDIEKIHNYDERFRVCQDYDLWFRGMAAGYKFYNIQEPLLQFRRNRTYNSRKDLSYRLTDFKVRLNGYKINHLGIKNYIYLGVPIALAIIPDKVIDKLFYLLKGFDPRNKQ